jgi:hypothetical protein
MSLHTNGRRRQVGDQKLCDGASRRCPLSQEAVTITDRRRPPRTGGNRCECPWMAPTLVVRVKWTLPAQTSMSLPGQEGEASVAEGIPIVGRLDMGVTLSLLWRIIKRRVGATCNESQVTTHSLGASPFVPSDITSSSVVRHANLLRLCV